MEIDWQPRPTNNSTNRDLIFQTLDWYCVDEVDNSNTESDVPEFPRYTVYVFGVCMDGFPVSLRLVDFFPFFFIEVPQSFDSSCTYSLNSAFRKIGLKPKSIEYLERKRYYGFENNRMRKFMKLTFYTNKSMRFVKGYIEKNRIDLFGELHKFDLYESNIDPVLRLTHIRDILTAGWVQVKQNKYTFEGEYFQCSWKNVNHYHSLAIANFQIMYYDIEACSIDGSFPDALKPSDRVTQICAIIKNNNTTTKYLFNVDSIDAIEDSIVYSYPTERQMLIEYSRFMNEIDPDIIVGYNIFGFDNGYLFERAKVLNIEGVFNKQSKIDYFTEIQAKTLNNQQSGFNDWKMTRLVGRIHIDLLQVIKKDFKLESYKLNTVGEHFLGEGKDDVSPKEIFEAWNPQLGTSQKRTIVGKYCVQDTNLCLLLFEKFAVLPNHIEMAKVTRVPVEYLVTRGQSIKVFSQIAYETRKAGYLIPVLPKMETEGKFQGATVLESKAGYYNRPVCGLDFASLYPSIMIAFSLCYSTIVLDEKYLGIPGIEYTTIKCGGDLNFTFVQNQPGVLVDILKSLWANRKITKKEMNAATDPFLKMVLNAKQLAIKVSMNSIYGFTGATVGALPCLGISQSVTSKGREMIEQTQTIAKEQFQCEIVYGDSVSGDTPVLVRIEGEVRVVSIETLFGMFKSQEYPQFKSDQPGLFQKQQSVPWETVVDAWTASGWKPLRRTIRHYCLKNMYRIITDSGMVDVTEDHSLLDSNLNQVKPLNVYEGMELFHSFPYNDTIRKGMKNYSFSSNNKVELQRKYLEARKNGYGVEIVYNTNGEVQLNMFDIFQKTMNCLKRIKRIIPLGQTDQFVYDLETADGTFQAGIGQMIVKNTDSCYVIFPDPIDPDGTLTTLFKKAELASKEISKTFKKPIELEFEKFMYPYIGICKKRYIYLEWTDPKHHNGEIEAKGVELVRRDNCPYVKESLSAVLNPVMFEKNIEKGIEAAKLHIDTLFKGEVPIKKLILSKTLRNDYKGFEKKYPYLLDSKGDKIKENGKFKVDTSGPYIWIHTKEIKEKNADGKNVKTGTYEKIEEVPNMGHVALVERMRERDPNGAPKPGDRVPFVYIDTGNPNDTSAQKTEDPVYVQENKIPIDSMYYYIHQLASPMENILKFIIGEEPCKKLLYECKSYLDAKKKEKQALGDYKRIKDGNKDIRSFFGGGKK
jgi:DNA polymerase delta subunit 1